MPHTQKYIESPNWSQWVINLKKIKPHQQKPRGQKMKVWVELEEAKGKNWINMIKMYCIKCLKN